MTDKPMTELLERAFKQAAELPEAAQDALAEWLLAELRDETEWEKLLTETPEVSPEELQELAAELEEPALDQNTDGETQPGDFDGR